LASITVPPGVGMGVVGSVVVVVVQPVPDSTTTAARQAIDP
jgi:hypothetical protein